MLIKFQKYEKKIMFGLVIFTALAFGITSQMLSIFSGGNQENMAGEIMGRKVSKEQFQSRRNQCAIWVQCWLTHYERYSYKILSFIPPFDMVDAELYNKKKDEYFDELTWVVLMLDAQADKAGIQVSPNEIVDYIKNRLFIFSPRESENSPGVFSKERYQWILSQWRISEVSFEETAAEFIKIQKYRDLVEDAIVPNTKEVYDEFLSRNEDVKIAWLAFDGNNYLGKTKVNDEDELVEYFQGHSAEYEVPQKVQIEYIMADVRKFKDGLPQPNDEALQNYYNKNREKEYKSKAFPEVRDEINNKLLDNVAKEQALERISKAEERITLLELQGKEVSLNETARKFNLDYQLTGFVALDNIDELEKELGASSLFQRQIATFQEGELSRAISTDKGNFIFRLLKKQGTYIPKLTDQIKEKVTRDFLRYKANEAAKAAAHKLVQNISDKVNDEIKGKENDELAYESRRKWFDAFTKEDMVKVKVARTAFFQKDDKLALLKDAGSDFKDAIFKMKRGKIDVVSDGDVYYVAQILDRRVPSAGTYDAEKERILKSISSKKKDEFNKKWLDEMKKQTNWKKYTDKKAKPVQDAPVPLDY
ncbi:MAG: SurA N-terminal domain-containing protein [Planctomycetes bacterium]|nr:SurA N-terminal domain-containing protein [Planctomycetota bacterium]